ncbi:PIN domain-containing protein [Methylobacterium sp. A54F]
MIVVDANVILSGLRSRNGAAHQVLRGRLTGQHAFAASPAVMLEYEDVLMRPGALGEQPWIEPGEVDVLLDALCARAVPARPWFRFRPFLADPKDDLYIECALAAGAGVIVTFDRHFAPHVLSPFGLEAATPGTFLSR